jgi:hypothetical protein
MQLYIYICYIYPISEYSDKYLPPLSFFSGTIVWTQGFVLQSRYSFYLLSNTSSPFCYGSFGNRVWGTICPSLLQTLSLPISASQVAKITGVSHWLPAHRCFPIHSEFFFFFWSLLWSHGPGPWSVHGLHKCLISRQTTGISPNIGSTYTLIIFSVADVHSAHCFCISIPNVITQVPPLGLVWQFLEKEKIIMYVF